MALEEKDVFLKRRDIFYVKIAMKTFIYKNIQIF